MALPTTALAGQLAAVLQEARYLSKRASELCAHYQAASVSANDPLAAYQRFAAGAKLLRAALDDRRLLEHGAQQTGAVDFAGRLMDLVDAVEACCAWIRANFPTDADGWLLKDRFDAGGDGLNVRRLTPAQLAPLCDLLRVVADAVE